MEKKISIIKDCNGVKVKVPSSEELRFLYLLLSDGSGDPWANRLQLWVKDSTLQEIESNSFFCKKSSQFIEIGWVFDEDDSGSLRCTIPQKDFIELLEKWRRFIKGKNAELTVTLLEDVYSIDLIEDDTEEMS